MAVIVGTSGADTLNGTGAADDISGLAGDDILNGGDGNDVLNGGSGADQLNGGNGIDTVSYEGSSSAVNVNLTTNVVSGGDAAGDVLTGFEKVIGSAYNDILASAGSQWLNGGAGDDTYIITGAGTVLTEAAGEGDDTVQTDVANMVLSANIERLIYTGASTFSGSGNASDNIITGGANGNALSGGAGNDTLNGGAGADTLQGEGDNDILNGGDGADILIGGAGADTLNGGNGIDIASYATSAAITINLRTGVHTGDAAGDVFNSIESFMGSTSNDTFAGDANANIFNGNTGTDTISYAGSTAAVNVNLTTNVYSGGDAQGDVLTAFETVIGSTFGDTLSSATSGHTLAGGTGDDLYIVGNAGVMIQELAGEGDDTVQTALASLTLAANIERLTYTAASTFNGVGNASNNIITGGGNGNTLSGGAGNDTLNGGAGADTLQGDGDNDILNGGDGADILIGGAGADQLNGGAGTDIASYATSAAITINLRTGVHTGDAAGDVFDSIESFMGTTSNDTFAGDASANTFNGNTGTDTISYAGSTAAVNVNLTTNVYTGGDAQGDVLTGFETVIGSTFGDTLSSSTSGHILAGALGDDLYIVGNAGVTIQELTGEGDDTVQTALATLTLGANIERLTYTGASTFSGTGNASANIITGGANGNTLYGGAGNDILNGGAGADTLYGEADNDILNGGDGADILIGGAGADQLNGGNGTDTVNYGTSSAITINLRTGVHTGDAAGDVFDSIESFVGSNANDTFAGDASANTFNGSGGTDTISYAGSIAAVNVNLTTNVNTGGDAQGDLLTGFETVIGSTFGDTLTSATSGHTLVGGAGDDLYIIGNAGTVIQELAGEGDDTVQTAVASLTLAANIERLTYTGASTFSGTGNASANIITGGANGNTLYGGAGNDILIGGVGADTLQGEADNDILNGGDGADILIGGAGADTLNGGAGIDIVSYGTSSAITINLRTGIHTGDAAGDVFDSIESFVGSNANDTFAGDASANTFNGSGGTDTISYAGSIAAVNVNLTTNVNTGGDAQGDLLTGFETVIGSTFGDTLTSATSGHTLVGGAGDDLYIVGNAGVTIQELTGEGDDTVQTVLASFSLGANIERLTYTGASAFTGYGNASDNIITGGANGNTLTGAAGNDTLIGGAGADTLYGDGDNDILIGGDGADILIGGAGGDTLNGGAGTDIVSYATSSAITINLRTGVHTGDAAGDVFDSIESFMGTTSNDTFAGDANANTFNGNTGTDTISYLNSTAAVNVNLTTNVNTGGDAQGDVLTAFERVVGSTFGDTLTSATSGHTLAGALGDDLYIVGNAGVTIQELAGEGDDTVQTALAALTLSDYVEQLIYTGSSSFTGTGSAQNNIITGGALADTLYGMAGDDILNGGNGNDTLLGGVGADHLAGGDGIDIASYADSTEAMTFDLLAGTISGIGAGDSFDGIEIIGGTNFGDIFYGGASADRIAGGGGVDLVWYGGASSGLTIDMSNSVNSTNLAAGDTFNSIEIVWGSSFSDIIVGDAAANAFIGADGGDVIDGGAGLDSVWYLNLNAGVSIDLSTGSNSAGDVLINVEGLLGTDYGDTLIGNSAANILEGGGGSDVLMGGDGDDFIYGAIKSDTGPFVANSGGAQADQLYGGAGNDTIESSTSDFLTTIFGGAGSDTISIYSAVAHGGDDNDNLSAHFQGYELYGDAGADVLNLFDEGYADGGEGSDRYYFQSSNTVQIKDTGISGSDGIQFSGFTSTANIGYDRVGNDLRISKLSDFQDNGEVDHGVIVLDYYLNNSIEHFYLQGGQEFFL